MFRAATLFDVEAFLKSHSVQFKEPDDYNGGKRWRLAECPFNSEHRGTSVAIGQRQTGELWFKCQHDGCAGVDWRQFRRKVDPAWQPANLTSNPKNPPLEVGLGSAQDPLSCDAADLFAEESQDELDYLQLLGRDGYLVRGWSHLLAGYPRVGKSELVTASVRDWLACGQRVLLISEEPKPLWRHRLRRHPAWHRGFRLYFGLGASPDVLLQEMLRADEPIIIVDSIRNLLQFEDENNNSEIARSLNPWIAGARRVGKTLIFIHHMRKGAGADGEGIAGGHALLGTVDIALELTRDPNQATNRRKIRGYARLIQPSELLYEMREDGSLIALGDPGLVAREEVEKRLAEMVSDGWLKTSELHDQLEDPKPSLEQVRLALTALAQKGSIDRDPPISATNIKGKTARWRRAQSNLTSNGASLGLEVEVLTCEDCGEAAISGKGPIIEIGGHFLHQWSNCRLQMAVAS